MDEIPGGKPSGVKAYKGVSGAMMLKLALLELFVVGFPLGLWVARNAMQYWDS
jgi:hypothetical protein